MDTSKAILKSTRQTVHQLLHQFLGIPRSLLALAALGTMIGWNCLQQRPRAAYAHGAPVTQTT